MRLIKNKTTRTVLGISLVGLFLAAFLTILYLACGIAALIVIGVFLSMVAALFTGVYFLTT